MALSAPVSKAKTRAFISYARKDSAFVSRLEEALEIGDVDVLRDTGDILPSEAWWKKIKDLIAQADCVVFVVSPDSLASKVVKDEVDFVVGLNKKLIPIVCRPVDDLQAPSNISDLNYIHFTRDEDFIRQVRVLLGTLRTDIEWIKQHTDIGLAAQRWRDADKANAEDLLLRRQLLRDAEVWLTRRPREAPEPTSLQLEFITASRRAARTRERGWVAGMAAVAIGAVALSAVAGWQSIKASRLQATAEQNTRIARDSEETTRLALGQVQASEQRAGRERDQALRTQSRFLAATSEQLLATGNATTAALLALDALPGGGNVAERPFVAEAQSALYRAVYRLSETATFEHPIARGSCEAGRPPRAIERKDRDVLLHELGNPAATRRFRHTGRVTDTTLATDHSRLFTVAEGDGGIRVWDVQSGQPISHLPMQGRNFAIQATADGSRILARVRTQDRGVQDEIWDASASGVQKILGMADGAKDVDRELDPAGHRLIETSQKPRIIAVRDVISGRVMGTWPQAESAYKKALSPAGEMIAIETVRGEVGLYDVTSGKPMTTVSLAGERPMVLSFSPDGRTLLVAPWGRSPAHVRGNGGLADAVTLEGGTPTYQGPVFSGDGSLIASGMDDGRTLVWSPSGGKPRYVLPAPVGWTTGQSITVAISARNTMVAVGLTSGSVTVHQLGRAQPLMRWAEHLKTDNVSMRLRFCNSDRNLAIDLDDDGRRVSHLVRVSGSELVRRFRENQVLALDTSDGTVLVSSDDGMVRYDPRDGSLKGSYEGMPAGKFEFAEFSADGSRFFGANLMTGIVAVFDARSGRRLSSIAAGPVPLTEVALSADGGRLVVAQADHVASVWDATMGTKLHELVGHTRKIHRAQFDPTGGRVLTTAGDGSVRLWQFVPVVTTKVVYTRTLSDYEKGDRDALMYGAQFVPGEPQIAVATNRDEVQVYDSTTGDLIEKRGNIGSVLEFDGSGRRLAVLYPFRNVFELRDGKDSKLLKRVEAANATEQSGSMSHYDGLPADSARFSPDGKHLITLFGDAPPQVWNADSGELIATLDAVETSSRYAFDARWSADGRHVLTFAARGAGRRSNAEPALWRIFADATELVGHTKSALPRCLTPEERKRWYLDADPPSWCRQMDKWPYQKQFEQVGTK